MDRIRLIAPVLLVSAFLGCASIKTSEPQGPVVLSGFALVNDLRIYYEIHGQPRPGLPPIVLLHGGGSTLNTSFSSLIPLLAKTRQVIAYDQQGHGRTADIKERPFSFTQSADDAASLLEALKIPQADFLGYSNGGHIAVEIAIRHPSVVRKLIIESAMLSRDGVPDPRFWSGFRNAKVTNMPPELKAEYLKVAPRPEDFQSFFEKCAKRMEKFKGWSRQQLKAIAFPTLFLVGDSDVATPEHAAKMAKLLPNARLAVLPDTDHMKIVQRSDWIAPLVLEFLK